MTTTLAGVLTDTTPRKVDSRLLKDQVGNGKSGGKQRYQQLLINDTTQQADDRDGEDDSGLKFANQDNNN